MCTQKSHFCTNYSCKLTLGKVFETEIKNSKGEIIAVNLATTCLSDSDFSIKGDIPKISDKIFGIWSFVGDLLLF